MIYQLEEIKPQIDSDAYVACEATVIGNVYVQNGASVWHGAVLRGDAGRIIVGENSNVQDNAVVHMSQGTDVIIGKGVTVGHNAVLHGCTVEDNVLIGMGAIVLDGAHIESNCIIGAGALISAGKTVEAGTLVLGVPGKPVRALTDDEIASNRKNAAEYVELSKKYKKSLVNDTSDID